MAEYSSGVEAYLRGTHDGKEQVTGWSRTTMFAAFCKLCILFSASVHGMGRNAFLSLRLILLTALKIVILYHYLLSLLLLLLSSFCCKINISDPLGQGGGGGIRG